MPPRRNQNRDDRLDQLQQVVEALAASVSALQVQLQQQQQQPQQQPQPPPRRNPNHVMVGDVESVDSHNEEE